MTLHLVPPTPPDRKTALVERIKDVARPDGMVQDLDPQTGCPGQARTARVFSLRGAHLIGMFSRTSQAQEFRRWVLDILDGHRAAPSLIQQWYEARAALDAQEKFASLCGRGLSEHKTKRPPLKQVVDTLMSKIQPTLQFQ